MKRILCSIVIVLQFSVSAFAAETKPVAKAQESTTKTTEDKNVVEKTQEVIHEAAQETTEAVASTRARREKASGFVLLNYSPLDLLIPSKIGGTLGLIRTGDKSWELEYLRGSISVPFIVEDLGKMTDQRISLIGRSYFGGNSFNISYGLSYFDFKLHIGDELLSRVTAGTYPSIDLVQLQSVGFNLAVGHRWTFKHNITFGVDWVSWAQPVVQTEKKSAFLDHASNADDRDDVDKAIKLIAYCPRLAFFKLQLGVLF